MPDDARLQRLEENQASLQTESAKHGLTLQHLGETIAATFDRFCEKVDDAVKPLAEEIREQRQHVAALGEKVGEHDRHIGAWAQAEQRARERWDGVKKFVVPVLSGAVAIGAKELIVWLAKH